jgi:flagellin
MTERVLGTPKCGPGHLKPPVLPSVQLSVMPGIVPTAGLERMIITNLRRNEREQRRVVAQLASGLQVERARDGPASVARAAKLYAMSKSRGAALQNTLEAKNAVQIAEGGLQEIGNILSRLRQLAVQGASEVMGSVDRNALQTEFASQLAEIDRISETTDMGGSPLLQQARVDVAFVLDTSGSMGAELTQVVSSITAMFNAFTAAGVDAQFGLARARANLDPADGVVRTVDIGGGGFAGALAATPGTIAGGAMDPYSALLNASGADDFNGDGDAFTWRAETASHIVYVTDTGQETVLHPSNPTALQTANQLAAAGVEVHVIARAANFGTYSQITSQTGGVLSDIGNGAGSGVPAALDAITQSMLGASPEAAVGALEVQVGIGATADDRIDLQLPVDASRVGLGVSGSSVISVAEARSAITTLDEAIDQVGEMRATMGATWNRLDHAIRNTETMLAEQKASLSVLQDTDFAEVTAAYGRAQIFQQAAVAMLADAMSFQKDVARLLYAPGGAIEAGSVYRGAA